MLLRTKLIALIATGVSIGTMTLPVLADTATGNGNPNDKLPVYLDRSLHGTAEDSCTPGFIWQGAGNPNTTFQRKRNEEAGVELGLKAIVRTGPDIRSTYVDGDGLVHIEVPAGAQPGNPGKAAWNFTYSYDVDLANPDLDQYKGDLWIDLDPSKKTNYLKLRLSQGGTLQPNPCLEPDTNFHQWRAGTTVVIPDDEGNQKVTQNSQNYAFYLAAIGDTDGDTPGVQPYAYGPAEFDVVLMLTGKGNDSDGANRSTKLHVVFDVVTTPTQTP